MPIEPHLFPPNRHSRREWLSGSLRLGGALAALQVRASTDPVKPRPWNRPIPLGRSGVQVTPLGFGCEGAKDPQLIRRAVDLGITHFNSFPDRGDLGNFPVVGEALRPVRSQIVLASGSNHRTRTGLLEDLDRQLKAFNTDHVDLFYLLAVSKAESLTDELIEALRTARQAGKIRAGALSTHGFAAVLPRLLAGTDTIKALMVTCNFASWDSGGWTEALPAIRQLRDTGVGIVAMKSLLGGMGEPPTGRKRLGEALKTPAGRSRVMAAALRWVLGNELVDTVPLLIQSAEELEASTQAAAAVLTADDERLLTAAVHQARPGLCRLCPTCTASCRAGLPVSEVMRMLMYAEGYGDLGRGQAAFATLSDRLGAVRCGDCPECTARCPNGVRVKARMSVAQACLT